MATTILVAVLIVAGGCKKEPPNNQIPDPVKHVHVYCKDQQCEIESIDHNGTVVFNNLPEEMQPRKDDIIVSYPTEIAPYGFLYKVKTVNASGGKTTVTTEPATIEEAVENAIINKTFNLNENELVDQVVQLDGGLSAKLEGTIEIELTANFDLIIENSRLKNMKFTVSPEITSKITLDFEGKIQAEQKINIAKVRFASKIIMAGKLPIVLVPEVAVDVLVDINGDAKIKATLVDAIYQSVYGVEYNDGKYSAIDDVQSQPANNLDYETLLLDGEIKVQPLLFVDLMFYGVEGLNVNGGMPVKLMTDVLKKSYSEIYGFEEANPKMNLTLGSEFGLELKSKILSKNLSDWNTKYIPHKWLVWERKIFPEFENVRISNQDASSRIITAEVKGWSGMFPIEQYGFCWGTAPLPTVNDNKKELGKLEISDDSTSITIIISDLESNTSYYARPFFENYFGVFYGQVTEFPLGCPEITLDQAALPFGDVTVNTSKQLTVTVRNTGDETLKISSITSSDPAFSVFSTEFTLPPDTEDILLITFSPAQERSYSATLTIQSNSCGKTKTVALTGAGTPPPCPVIALNPDSRSFGDVATNTSEQRQITVKNTGNAMLEISSITSSDPAFTVSSTVYSLLPNEEGVMYITFSPTQERMYSATLTIQSNAAEKTKTVPLTGRGVTLKLVAIMNPSMETGNSDNSLPAGWTNNVWSPDLLTAQFTYLLNEGHTGNRSIRVDVTNVKKDLVTGEDATDCDAKWMFEPVHLEPGGYYVFSNWYKSNVETDIVLVVTNTAGQLDYFDLLFVPGSETWTKLEAPFTMPRNGVKASVYHVIKKTGWLITDDYHIGYYKGFDRGMVTITFDDAWEENPETALPVMKQYGFKSTQYYATTFIKDTPWNPHPWAKQQIQKFINTGHEIGSHTVTHPWLTTLTEKDLIYELAESKQYLESYLGVPIKHFASSYGNYNTYVKNKIMEYYVTHRTVDEGYNSRDNLDISRLKNMCIKMDTPISEFENWVKRAKEEKLWLILLYHKVGGSISLGIDDTTPEKFAQQMKLIHDYGIEVVTISEALEKIKNQ